MEHLNKRRNIIRRENGGSDVMLFVCCDVGERRSAGKIGQKGLNALDTHENYLLAFAHTLHCSCSVRERGPFVLSLFVVALLLPCSSLLNNLKDASSCAWKKDQISQGAFGYISLNFLKFSLHLKSYSLVKLLHIFSH